MRLRSDVPLEPGDRGTAQTVREMRTLARQGVHHKAIRATADFIAAGAAEAAGNPRRNLAPLLRGLLCLVEFLPDDDAAAAYGVGGDVTELVRAPWLTLAEGAGDCDDVATLGASLALALGLRARFVTVGPPGGPFVHVFAEVLCCPRYGWHDLDTTRDVQGLPADWSHWRKRLWPI